MAINPVNIARVSQNLRSDFAVDSLRRTQREVFISQNRIATGRNFVTAGEDPVGAARAVDLTRALEQQDQFMANLQHGDNFLSAADNALSEINDLLTQASVIASQNVGDLTNTGEREAEAEVVASIRDQLQTIGNTQFDGRYIFGGRDTVQRPFVDGPEGVAYVGDTGELLTRIANGLTASISMPGSRVFGALSAPIATDIDLTPALTESTRLDDLTGANDRPVTRGTLVFNESGGVGAFTVDLTAADTIGDVARLINEAAVQAGARLTASVTDAGLTITPAGGLPVSISDTSTGVITSALGILTQQPTADVISGHPLGARVTRLTPVEALAGGNGIDLSGGLVITNGPRSATIDVSSARTAQDIINTINNAGVFVLARVKEDGSGIDVFNQVSGSSLTIGENGGTTAADLGIRTFDTATPLDLLNFGRGVATVDDEDHLRITAKDGSTVDVNLDGAVTVGDVINLINQAAQDAGVAITASFTETGNGIQVSDETGGADNLSVSGLNLSTAAIDLGIAKTVSGDGTVLVGDDVNPTRTEGIISALVDLENALRADDTQAISLAGGRLDALRAEGTRMHGVIGARSQGMQTKLQQMNDAAATTQVSLSEIQDLDYAEAVTRMQAAITQLQANLQSSSNYLGLSLLDYLT